MGVPVVEQRQALNIQTEQKTTDVSQIQCLEPLVDVLVVTQQTAEIPVVMLMQVPTLQRIQKIVEGPQIQYIDKVVDAPVNMQPAPEMEHVASTLATEWEASTPHFVDSSLRKRKSSGSLQSPRARAGMRTQVQDDDIRHEIFHVNIASTDEMEEAASVHALTSLRTRSELDDVKSGVEHVKEDLQEVRKMLEFLVRRERKVHMQTEVATRRLEKEGEGQRERGRVQRDPGGGSGRPVEGREGDRRQTVCRQRLRLRQNPDRADRLHPRQRTSSATMLVPSSCRGRVPSTKSLGTDKRRTVEKANRVAQSEKKVAQRVRSPSRDFAARVRRAHCGAEHGSRWLTPSGRNDATLAVRQPAFFQRAKSSVAPRHCSARGRPHESSTRKPGPMKWTDLYVKAIVKDGVQMRERLVNMRPDELWRSQEQ